MAQGLIGAMHEIGRAGADIERTYAHEAGRAQKALTGDLGPRASLELTLAAFRNTNGIGGEA